MKIIPIIHSLMGELLVVIMVHLGNAMESGDSGSASPDLNNFQEHPLSCFTAPEIQPVIVASVRGKYSFREDEGW